ncbi:cilia- and flagella-associated protein 276 [Pholidichthys leucotaenia]
MSGRDPFPSPKLENDSTLSGFRPQQRRTFNKPTHNTQPEEPWSRLYNTATVASTRRSVTHFEHQAPNDSLDLQLKSIYDHHKNAFWGKNQILYQKDTVSEDQKTGKNLEEVQKQEQPNTTQVIYSQHEIMHRPFSNTDYSRKHKDCWNSA